MGTGTYVQTAVKVRVSSDVGADVSTAAATPLREAVLAALRQALAAPAHSAKDDTLDRVEWVCRCADGTAVIGWAESAQAPALTLAIAQARRGHVQQSLLAAAAPLVCTTLHQGSPHKLVINKAPGLHDSRLQRRRRWAVDLGALESGTAAQSDLGRTKPRRSSGPVGSSPENPLIPATAVDAAPEFHDAGTAPEHGTRNTSHQLRAGHVPHSANRLLVLLMLQKKHSTLLRSA
jgi:hypothetical protein